MPVKTSYKYIEKNWRYHRKKSFKKIRILSLNLKAGMSGWRCLWVSATYRAILWWQSLRGTWRPRSKTFPSPEPLSLCSTIMGWGNFGIFGFYKVILGLFFEESFVREVMRFVCGRIRLVMEMPWLQRPELWVIPSRTTRCRLKTTWFRIIQFWTSWIAWQKWEMEK